MASDRLRRAIRVLNSLEAEMLKCKTRTTGFRTAFQVAKCCGMVVEIATHLPEGYERDSGMDAARQAMRRVYLATNTSMAGDPIQLEMFGEEPFNVQA